ncbi:MAG: prepilin-type N-terminal cleavage/methylation domain-containing protein [Lysobacterales bacterium]
MNRHRHGRTASAPRGSRGFSLLEIIVAFVVFALAFGLLMQVASGSLRNARHSAHFTQAALLAQSKLDELGVGEPLEEGSDSGRFDERYDWRLDVRKQDAPPAANGNLDELPFELMHIELTVEWRDGVRTRDARFVTERIQQKLG